VRLRPLVLLVLLTAVAVLGGGCTSEGPGGGATGATSTTGPTDRVSVVTAAATKVIAPAYAGLAKAAAELDAATAACNLERSRTAWRETRLAYMQTVAAQGVGPAKDQRLLPAIDFWPTDASGIEAFVAGPGPFTLESVAALGARQRGLHAIETLLFREGFFERQRCQVSNLLSVLVRRAADGVAAAWADLAPRFGSQDRALAEVVSSITQSMGLVEGEQLGMPYGLRRGATVNPALVRGRNALDDSVAVIEGSQALLEAGVAPLISTDLAGRLRGAVETAEATVKNVPAPLQLSITNARPQVLAGIQACKAVEQLLATEVTTALGIVLSFNPNDGD
jgi:predicted lipoprotein